MGNRRAAVFFRTVRTINSIAILCRIAGTKIEHR